jgi:hypothetical protein
MHSAPTPETVMLAEVVAALSRFVSPAAMRRLAHRMIDEIASDMTTPPVHDAAGGAAGNLPKAIPKSRPSQPAAHTMRAASWGHHTVCSKSYAKLAPAGPLSQTRVCVTRRTRRQSAGFFLSKPSFRVEFKGKWHLKSY